jgi:hypothetical protein
VSKVDEYRAALRQLDDWDAYLMANSKLPGPRGNLELAQAVADLATPSWIAAHESVSAGDAPENTAESFLVFAAVQGLGRLAVEGDATALPRLRGHASDPRWRVRESVAIALQRLGDVDMPRLLDFAEELASGTYLEQRAAAAAVCEPRLLKDAVIAGRVLSLLDGITAAMAEAPASERRGDDFRTLRQAMGYCWSVAVVAAPDAGKAAFERWLASPDSDVRWMLRENLKKNRLLKLDTAWVSACLAKLT